MEKHAVACTIEATFDQSWTLTKELLLARELHSEVATICTVKGRQASVWLEDVAFHSVSYMAVLIGEVNDGITFKQSSFSKVHEYRVYSVVTTFVQ